MLTEKMIQRLEGAHVSFLWQATRENATRKMDGSWQQVTAESVLQGAGTQTFRKYVDRRQATVAEWLNTQTILTFMREIQVTREGGYSRCRGGGRRQRNTR